MTVTRKDLNAIASTLNQRIQLYLKQGELDKAKAVWYTAEEMYSTMVILNPMVSYAKWRKAICIDFCIEEILTEDYENEKTKPTLRLSDNDGNAFMILGTARRVAKQAGWSKVKISEVMNEATSGDYNHVLQTMMKHFEVE